MIVLDVACGAAHAAEPVAEQVCQVVGVDLSPALLEVGAQRLRVHGITNVSLQEANAESLAFLDGSFDIDYGGSSLHHFTDPHRAVTEMVRVDPPHTRSFLAGEVVELLPGDVDSVANANIISLRQPVEIALTDQSESAAIFEVLAAEMEGEAGRGVLHDLCCPLDAPLTREPAVPLPAGRDLEDDHS